MQAPRHHASLRRNLLLALASLPLMAQATEEPAYEVQRRLGDAEVRLYAPYVVAEVEVPGPAEAAGNRAFPILAGYIFGKNQGERKLAMTAPVTQAVQPVKLAMTAPVAQVPTAQGFVVQFVLPRDVTLETAPLPDDARVRLRQMPARQWAVIRYSGFWSDANYAEHLAKLTDALRQARQPWVGEPLYARYDPPITPWFLRRNEIWLALP